MLRWLFFALSLAVPAAPLAASADTDAQLPPPTAAALVETLLQADLEARTDSNVARANAQRAAAEGLVRADQRITPEILLSIARPIALMQVSLHGSFAYDFYRRNHRLNREKIYLTGDVGVPLAMCQVDFAPTLTRRQSELSDLQTIAAATVRNTETTEDYLGTLSCNFGTTLRPFARIQAYSEQNSNPLRRFLDNRTDRTGLGLVYSSPELGSLQAVYQHGDTTYPLRLAGPGLYDGYHLTTYQVRLDRDLGALFSGMLQIGFAHLAPHRKTAPNFSGLVWGIELTSTAIEGLQIRGSMSRRVEPSLSVDAAYRVTNHVELSETYALSSLLSIRLGEVIEAHRYAAPGTELGPRLTHDRRKSIIAVARYNPSAVLGLELEGGFETRHAPGNFYNYNELYFALRTHHDF